MAQLTLRQGGYLGGLTSSHELLNLLSLLWLVTDLKHEDLSSFFPGSKIVHVARKNGQPPRADNKQGNRDLRNELSISRELGRLHPGERGSHGDILISAQ